MLWMAEGKNEKNKKYIYMDTSYIIELLNQPAQD